MKNWKRWLKGHYDTHQKQNIILVTGSAKIETYKKMGDSLAGRYYQYRLFPLDIKELVNTTEITPDKALTKFLELSGFPEPFLSGNKNEYHKWQKTHLDIILKQDLLETESVQHIKSIELLIELMTDRIASHLSYNSLREDLGTMLEAKLSDSNFDQDFSIFEKQTGSIPKYLLVKNLKKKTSLKDGTIVVSAAEWLSKMEW